MSHPDILLSINVQRGKDNWSQINLWIGDECIQSINCTQPINSQSNLLKMLIQTLLLQS